MMIVPPPIATGGRAIYPAITELAAIPRWVCWKLEERNGKPTKPPYCVGGRRLAKSTDPRTWDTFDACWRSAFVDGVATGVGIVLDGSDDLLAADLDHCIVPSSGEVVPWAKVVMRMLDSYTERSPSGTGLRIFFRGAMADKGRKIKFRDGHLELYRAERYLTVTGAHQEMTPDTINQVPAEVIDDLLSRTEQNRQSEPNGHDPHPTPEIPDELRDKLNDAMAEDTRLWEAWDGQAPAGSDQTRSAFDLRLAGALRANGTFTIAEFATLARHWQYGKGADGDPRHWRRTWEKANTAQSKSESEPGPVIIGVRSSDLLTMPIPPRTIFLDPWIASQSISMVVASRGTGKTFFLLAAAIALAKGEPFLGWNVPEPRTVCYVEGELPRFMLRDRIQLLGTSDNLTIVNPELQPNMFLPHLATEAMQQAFEPLIESHDVIFLDSLATLAPCAFDKDSEVWNNLQTWFLSIRRRGKALVFAHHTNKAGSQRGISAREDILDSAIRLDKDGDAHGCRFNVEFTKTRQFETANPAKLFEPFNAEMRDGQWTTTVEDPGMLTAVVDLTLEGKPIRAIADIIGLSKSLVHKLQQRARGRGLL